MISVMEMYYNGSSSRFPGVVLTLYTRPHLWHLLFLKIQRPCYLHYLQKRHYLYHCCRHSGADSSGHLYPPFLFVAHGDVLVYSETFTL